jgi:hypothetical protein
MRDAIVGTGCSMSRGGSSSETVPRALYRDGSAYGDHAYDCEDDDEVLDEEELSLLEDIGAAWSPSSSSLSAAPSTVSCGSRPIAIPAAT